MTNEILKRYINIIGDPAHHIGFYNNNNFKELILEIEKISGGFEIEDNTPNDRIIEILNNYIKTNIVIRRKYFDAFSEIIEKFDINELVYRTAYGALLKKQAMCAGHTELLRLLLARYNIESKTIISKLPGENKKLLHYVTIAYFKDNNEKIVKVLDPERESNCEKKGKDFEKYQKSMIYLPIKKPFINDIVGELGVGIPADEYIKTLDSKDIKEFNQVGEFLENLEDLDQGEKDNENRIY